jgi:protein AATF/BFR2
MSRRKQLEKIFNNKEHKEEEEFEDYLNEQDMKKYKDKTLRQNLRNNDQMQKELSKYHGKKVNYKDIYDDNQNEDQEEDFEDEEIGDDENIESDEEVIEDDDNLEQKTEDNQNDSLSDNEEQGEDFSEENYDEEVEQTDEKNEEMKNKKSKSFSDNKKTNEKSPSFNKEQMDKDDEEYMRTITMHTPNEIKKGKNVINQKNLFDFLIGLRISLQKIITSLAILPQGKTFNKFIDDSNSRLIKSTINNILKLLISLISFQKELFLRGNLISSIDKIHQTNSEKDFNKILNKILELSSKVNNNEDELPNFDEVYNIVRPVYDRIMAISEKILDIWYRKTLVYSFKSTQGNKMLKILNNNFCDHIKSNIDTNFNSIREKTMKTSINEKILGKRNRSITREFDEEIYNDNDFYSYLLKEFISGKEDSMKNDSTNSRYDLTLQYLMNRQKNKKNKNIDTKASKCRKLRYDKHEKIINFMVPFANHRVNFGRDEIVRSIFGLERGKANKSIEDVDEDSGIEII